MAKITCVKVTGTKTELDRVMKEMNTVLAKLASERGTVFNTILDYPTSILFKFEDPNDANMAAMKISILEQDYDEIAKRTKNGAVKVWKIADKEVLKMVVMPESLGYERNWNI